MRTSLLVTCFALPFYFHSQENIENKPSVTFELGTRSTVSLFEHDSKLGIGTGGQFRFSLNNRLNTEWFADYIKTNLSGDGFRRTYHIGWSVMFHLNDMYKKNSPYLLAGHCFDYAMIQLYDENNSSQERNSMAVQIGVGNRFNLTENLNIGLSAQYMFHIGNSLATYRYIDAGNETISFAPPEDHHGTPVASSGLSLEGHILVTASLNYVFWRKHP